MPPSLHFPMDVEDEDFLPYPDSPRTLPIENPTNALDDPMPQLARRTLPIDILARVAASEVSLEGASRAEAAEQTN